MANPSPFQNFSPTPYSGRQDPALLWASQQALRVPASAFPAIPEAASPTPRQAAWDKPPSGYEGLAQSYGFPVTDFARSFFKAGSIPPAEEAILRQLTKQGLPTPEDVFGWQGGWPSSIKPSVWAETLTQRRRHQPGFAAWEDAFQAEAKKAMQEAKPFWEDWGKLAGGATAIVGAIYPPIAPLTNIIGSALPAISAAVNAPDWQSAITPFLSGTGPLAQLAEYAGMPAGIMEPAFDVANVAMSAAQGQYTPSIDLASAVGEELFSELAGVDIGPALAIAGLAPSKKKKKTAAQVIAFWE